MSLNKWKDESAETAKRRMQLQRERLVKKLHIALALYGPNFTATCVVDAIQAYYGPVDAPELVARMEVFKTELALAVVLAAFPGNTCYGETIREGREP